MSQITTHVLDTAAGIPAEGVASKLFFFVNDHWKEISSGVTNNDGRISDLIKNDDRLKEGIYKMNFDTGSYFSGRKIKGFYPYVDIIFEINSGEHYHIPLLLSPFGYSTYRGS